MKVIARKWMSVNGKSPSFVTKQGLRSPDGDDAMKLSGSSASPRLQSRIITVRLPISVTFFGILGFLI